MHIRDQNSLSSMTAIGLAGSHVEKVMNEKAIDAWLVCTVNGDCLYNSWFNVPVVWGQSLVCVNVVGFL